MVLLPVFLVQLKVGWALNSTKNLPKWVPAHRVVNKKGLLTGKMHFGGSETMRELLNSEGINVKDNQIIDFEKIFWDPSKELK